MTVRERDQAIRAWLKKASYSQQEHVSSRFKRLERWHGTEAAIVAVHQEIFKEQ